jgi:hypothetical protein
MISHFPFDAAWLDKLLRQPETAQTGTLGPHRFRARIAIPHYIKRIESFFEQKNIPQFSQRVEVPCNFRHFGLVIDFADAVELQLHDEDLVLADGLRYCISQTGPVILRNVFLPSPLRSFGHRNRFPHLNFHIDRNANQATRYSVYTRDPFDSEQRFPRTSSTLFIANIVAVLQGMREGTVDPATEKGMRGTYNLFQQENMDNVLGNIVLEHAWDCPEGTGEISMLDNATTLHASYYREPAMKGYKIGVRYVA